MCGSKMTWFLHFDRNELGSSIVIEIDLFFVWGSDLAWFLCGGRRRLGCDVWIEIDLDYEGDRT